MRMLTVNVHDGKANCPFCGTKNLKGKSPCRHFLTAIEDDCKDVMIFEDERERINLEKVEVKTSGVDFIFDKLEKPLFLTHHTLEALALVAQKKGKNFHALHLPEIILDAIYQELAD